MTKATRAICPDGLCDVATGCPKAAVRSVATAGRQPRQAARRSPGQRAERSTGNHVFIHRIGDGGTGDRAAKAALGRGRHTARKGRGGKCKKDKILTHGSLPLKVVIAHEFTVFPAAIKGKPRPDDPGFV
jgi:hypothetical protein